MWYVVIALLLGFAAVNTGNNLLFLIVSALLAFMAVSGLVGWQNLRNLRVTLDFPDEVFAGRETLLSMRLRNDRKLLSAFLMEGRACGVDFPFALVEPGEEGVRAATVVLPQRGRHPVQPVTVSSPFPVNFFVRSRELAFDGDIVVFPRPVPAVLPLSRSGARRGEEPVSRRGEEGDILSISGYTGGESRRRIHWRLSARQNELMVKDLSAVAAEPVMLDLADLPGNDLEERIGACAYLVNRLIRQGRGVGLVLPGLRIEPRAGNAQRLRLLTELALHR